jgi:hypothetical protein
MREATRRRTMVRRKKRRSKDATLIFPLVFSARFGFVYLLRILKWQRLGEKQECLEFARLVFPQIHCFCLAHMRTS